MSGAPARASLLRGVLLLARGRGEGMACFRSSPEAFLASLAPLLALPLAAAALLVVRGAVMPAVAVVLLAVTTQVAPAVLSHAAARALGREDGWLRYATAYNWCQWANVAVMAVLLLVLSGVTGAPVPAVVGSPAFGYAVLGYSMWLHWVLARSGLALSRWRAAGLVLAVSFGTMLLVFGPEVARVLLQAPRGAGG
ncbi:MAG TPA: hypothetical protein VGC15_13875 [Acetobacteraceae bacterium]